MFFRNLALTKKLWYYRKYVISYLKSLLFFTLITDVDFIFYPEDRSDTCIILELKVDHTPEEAIEQIRDKDYMLRFMGKLGELPKYTGEILGVGISYSKTDKIHRCKTEILRNRI